MSVKYIVLPILIIFLFASGITLGQSVKNDTSLANSTLASPMANISSTDNSTAAEASPENASAASSAQNLKYIWQITGIESDPVTMALNQSGSDLFGQAKYEPSSGEAWNGLVDGSITGNQVNLVLTVQKGNNLESTKLDGTYTNGDLNGKFTTRDNEGKTIASGNFDAIWTDPNISDYTPAKVTEPATSQPQAAAPTTAAVQPSNTTSTTDQSSEGYTPEGLQTGPIGSSVTVGNGGTKYVNVEEYADKIGPGGDLSGVPPGMGGSGLE